MENYKKICSTSSLENCIGQKFILDDENEIAVFKIEQKFYVFDNICPHNHVPRIADGKIVNNYLICPVHGQMFHIETGKQKNQQGGNIKIFEHKVIGDELFVKIPETKKFNFKY
jgi:nitrite reductase/ring-hydroxylating ferredoxin subunit